MTYISPEQQEQIQEAGNLVDIILDDNPTMQKKGSNYIGECPQCGGKDGFNLKPGNTSADSLFKCFNCNLGGKYPLQYYKLMRGQDHNEALLSVAKACKITIEPYRPPAKQMGKISKKGSFRDYQLKLSGIPLQSQKYTVKIDDKEYPDNYRYQDGSINGFGDIDTLGPDMLLRYRNLDGSTKYFIPDKGKKKELIRVRYQNPELDSNRTKDGKVRKYASPYGSGSHLWIPNKVIDMYKSGAELKMIGVPEGEKKTDKLTLHGLPCVGLMGIHNLSYDHMPADFEQLVMKFDINTAAFILDADWRDIKYSADKSIDHRPRVFCSAIIKFRKFFNVFNKKIDDNGRYAYNIKIMFGAHKSDKHKGMDDYLVAHKGQEDQIVSEMKDCITNAPHNNDRFEFYDITSMSDMAIKKLFHIQTSKAFIDHYQNELKDLPSFRIGKVRYKYNKDEGSFELLDKVTQDEKFWIEIKDKETEKIKDIKVKRLRAHTFLYNRGIGNYMRASGTTGSSADWLIHIENNIVTKIDPTYIQRYILDFSKNLHTDYFYWETIAEKILAGSSQYFSPQQCAQIPYHYIQFHEGSAESETIPFRSGYVHVTKNEITMQQTQSKYFWKDEVIEHDITITKPLFQLKRAGKTWDFKWTDIGNRSEICKFINNTSMVFWEKCFDLQHDSEGIGYYTEKDDIMRDVTETDIQEYREHIVSKMLAIGYLCHSHINTAETKAVICMDLKESEVGASEGGSGKSVWSKIIENMIPTHVIPAKKKDITDDDFLFEGVDERHRVVVFDDARMSFDFEFLFPFITGPLTVNGKGEKKAKVGMKKFIINLNSMLRGTSGSHTRRQYNLGFCDYYNQVRTPATEFGHMLFRDWTNEQWNLFYNFVFQCIQIYLTYGLKFGIPESKLMRRRQRQEMGEAFREWGESRWIIGETVDPEFIEGNIGTTNWINNEVHKNLVLDTFLKENSTERKWTKLSNIRKRVKAFADYHGLNFNINGRDRNNNPKKGGFIKSGGKEFYCLSDENYDASKANRIYNAFDN